MREAIGGTWLFGLVITFIVFFASFLAVSINYSKAFNVKNEVVNIVSKYECNNCNSRNAIRKYLRYQGYMVTGTCPSGYMDLKVVDWDHGDYYKCIPLHDKIYTCPDGYTLSNTSCTRVIPATKN